MLYSLALARVGVANYGLVEEKKQEYSCKEVRRGCCPPFVFSVAGQVRFQESLRHLTICNKRCCQKLRKEIYGAMVTKLEWLVKEKKILGCVHVQPLLYGSNKVTFKRRDFLAVARHLAVCPKESCSQLRRALLLTVRGELQIYPGKNLRG